MFQTNFKYINVTNSVLYIPNTIVYNIPGINTTLKYITNINLIVFVTILFITPYVLNKRKRRLYIYVVKITLPDRNPIVIEVVILVVAPVPIAALLIPVPVQALLLVLHGGTIYLIVTGRTPRFLDPGGTGQIFHALYPHGDGGG